MHYRGSLKIYRALFDHITGAAVPFTEQASAHIAAQHIGLDADLSKVA
jgi:hypothetical protein